MFWIQEKGNGTKNNSAYTLFYAEFESDVDSLPTNSIEGTQNSTDKTVNKKCAIGSECLVIENGSFRILTSNGWQEV